MSGKRCMASWAQRWKAGPWGGLACLSTSHAACSSCFWATGARIQDGPGLLVSQPRSLQQLLQGHREQDSGWAWPACPPATQPAAAAFGLQGPGLRVQGLRVGSLQRQRAHSSWPACPPATQPAAAAFGLQGPGCRVQGFGVGSLPGQYAYSCCFWATGARVECLRVWGQLPSTASRIQQLACLSTSHAACSSCLWDTGFRVWGLGGWGQLSSTATWVQQLLSGYRGQGPGSKGLG